MEQIRAALTSEEWKAAHDVMRDTTMPAHLTTKGALQLPDAIYEYWVEGRERHQLAALALHGQPFGFRAIDVAMLRNLALILHHTGYGKESPWARDLAARIAALLPPEGP